MAVVGYATIQLIPSLKGFAGSTRGQMAPVVRSVGSDAGKQAGGLFGNSFLGSVGRIMSAAGIYELGSRVAGGISDAISTGIKGFADLQTYTISFKTLLGSASKADAMIRSLYDFAAKTPFDVEGSVVGAQKLLGVGVAAKDVVPTLTTLGDATAALGGSTGDFNSVLLAYSQIMARGKVSTQDLYQISNTGIPIFQLMSKALGKPVGEIQKLIETGNLASEDVLPQLLAVMNKDYGGAMAGQAQTLTGLWSTFKDTLKQTLTTAFTPLGEWLVKVLPGASTAATNAIQWIQDKFADLGTALSNTEFADALTPLISAFQDTDWDALANFVITAFAEIASGISPIVASIGQFVNQTLPPLSELLGTVADKSTAAGDTVSNAAGRMGAASQAAGDQAEKATNQFAGMGTVGDQLLGLQTVIDVLGPVAGSLTKVANAALEGESATGIFSDALTGKFGPAAQVAASTVDLVSQSIGRSFLKASLSVGNFVSGSAAALGAWAANTAVTAVRAMTQFGVEISTGIARAIAGARAGLSGLVSVVKSSISLAVSAVTGTVGQWTAAGRQIVQGLISGIKNAAGGAVDAAKGMVSNAINGAKKLLGIKSPSRVFRGIGAYTVEGFVQGITRNSADVQKAYGTFAAPNLAAASAPMTVGQSIAAGVSGSRQGTAIGTVNLSTASDNPLSVIEELNFYLRTLARGGV